MQNVIGILKITLLLKDPVFMFRYPKKKKNKSKKDFVKPNFGHHIGPIFNYDIWRLIDFQAKENLVKVGNSSVGIWDNILIYLKIPIIAIFGVKKFCSFVLVIRKLSASPHHF